MSWFATIKAFFNVSEKFDGLKNAQEDSRDFLHGDHKSLHNEHETIRKELQESRELNVGKFSDIRSTVNSIDNKLIEANNRVTRMTTSEQEMQDAVYRFENFIRTSQQDRRDARARYRTLEEENKRLRDTNDRLEIEVEDKKTQISDLEQEIRDLKPKLSHKSGPDLGGPRKR